MWYLYHCDIYTCVHILKELKDLFYYFQIFVSACRYMDMNAGTCRNQKCWTALSGNYIQIDPKKCWWSNLGLLEEQQMHLVLSHILCHAKKTLMFIIILFKGIQSIWIDVFINSSCTYDKSISRQDTACRNLKFKVVIYFNI